MSEIKLNINAPVTNMTVASSINTGQYMQSQNIQNQESSIEVLTAQCERNIGNKNTISDYMKPLEYLKIKEDDIYHNLVKENLFTEDEAKEIYRNLNKFVTRLTPLRHSESRTGEILHSIEVLPDKDMRIIQHWLLKAIQDDDTFVRAYNPLAQIENRRASWAIYQVKYISDSGLFRLLEKEKMKPDQSLESVEKEEEENIDNPLIFEESKMDNFHGALNDFLWESTDIFTFKNWFRVKPIGMPAIKNDMLSYFCYAVSLLEKHRKKEICPNIETWYKALTGSTTKFSKLKKQAMANKKGMRESKPTKLEIDRRLAHLRFF